MRSAMQLWLPHGHAEGSGFLNLGRVPEYLVCGWQARLEPPSLGQEGTRVRLMALTTLVRKHSDL